MNETELIGIVVSNWKRIGDILLAVDGNHSEKYYQVIPMLLDRALVSPFRIVASYCSNQELKSQFDDGITTSAIVWNCWLIELGAIVQLEMLRFAFADEADIPLDVLVSMEIGIELSRLRIQLDDVVIEKLGTWMKNMERKIIDILEDFETICENFERVGIKM
jgi:hypothetical protein